MGDIVVIDPGHVRADSDSQRRRVEAEVVDADFLSLRLAGRRLTRAPLPQMKAAAGRAIRRRCRIRRPKGRPGRQNRCDSKNRPVVD